MSSPALPPLAIVNRTRERAERVLRNNSSNTAKALARDSLELCELVDDFRLEVKRQQHPWASTRLRELAARLGLVA